MEGVREHLPEKNTREFAEEHPRSRNGQRDDRLSADVCHEGLPCGGTLVELAPHLPEPIDGEDGVLGDERRCACEQ